MDVGRPGSNALVGHGAGPGEALARLHEERTVLRARVAQLDADMTGLIAASRGSNADDEHDPEGQTIA
jgi:hypothetical protein